jgi:hypothetical protein
MFDRLAEHRIWSNEMHHQVTVEQVLELTKKLSATEKVRLIERITPQITRDLKIIRKKPRRSLRGLWRGVDIAPEDIDTARRELWHDFPRDDV